MKKLFLIYILLLTRTLFSEDFTIYTKDRLISPNLREYTFVEALKLMSERNVKTIVETGTARAGAAGFNGDGGSTIILGHWAHNHNARMFSVDINPDYVVASRSACKEYENGITFVCSDSLKFLHAFKDTIDFLYLDSLDYDFDNPTISQEHHLNEIKAIYKNLHDNAIIMIDDCGELPGGGKGGLVIPWLLDRGWKIHTKGYQVILTK
ncbi:hypothetical protein A3F66_05220 [candidate division TM6 bacterium RIFCSPHIGHO2_12_FULL_32_22]|nr:MAG: hypothetical protein A3F66_05220 [candidate division TM6 bacterium RIFCSPHIGHO2_12_FULL_32_22]